MKNEELKSACFLQGSRDAKRMNPKKPLPLLKSIYKQTHRKINLTLDCAWQYFLGYASGSQVFVKLEDIQKGDTVSVVYSYRQGKFIKQNKIDVTKDMLQNILKNYIDEYDDKVFKLKNITENNYIPYDIQKLFDEIEKLGETDAIQKKDCRLKSVLEVACKSELSEEYKLEYIIRYYLGYCYVTNKNHQNFFGKTEDVIKTEIRNSNWFNKYLSTFLFKAQKKQKIAVYKK